MQRTLLRMGSLAFGLTVGLAACGGGGTSGPYPPAPAPVATTPTISQGTFSGSSTVAMAATMSFPSAGGYTASLGLGGATIPGAATATLGIQSTAPTTVAPMLRAKYAPQDALANSVLAYLSFTPSATVTAAATVSITIPTGVQPSGTTLWLALNDPLRPSLGWQLGFAGPASVSGSTATFSTPSYQYVGGQTYWASVYAISTSAATPTPAPSISPLPTPTPSAPPGGSTSPSPSPTPTAGGVVIIQGVP